MPNIRPPVFALLACMAIPVSAQQDPSIPPASQPFGPRVLEEIVVTAQKRGEESLLDTAMSISSIPGEELARRGIERMDDYLRFEPGTNFIDRGAGRNSVIIRGITADPGRGGAITGVYIDEIPVQGLGFAATGSPDLGTVDVARVEVLRGPQGTLYGAGSMSGTVRTLTRAPELGAFGGYITLDGSVTSGFGDTNNDIQAVVNIPLVEERLAVRAVAYRFDKSGYIRNVAPDDPAKQAGTELFGGRFSDAVDDRGALEIEGFRLGALWRVNERFDIQVTAMGQETDQDGVPTIDVLQGPFEQSRFARLDGSDEGLSADLELYSLVLDYAAEDWSLVSASAWTEYDSEINWDVGIFFHDLFEGVDPPFWIYQATQQEVFIQEFRWVWDAGGRFQVLLGGFYEDRSSGFDQDLVLEGEGRASFPDREDASSRQVSVFADLVYGVTEYWEVTVGARYFDYDFHVRGLFGGIPTESAHEETGETVKLGVNWRPHMESFGEEPLLYLTWSEGFRPGFPVSDPGPDCDANGDGFIEGIGLPFKDIESDDLESLELGFKSTFAQRRVAVELAFFDIDWTHIPVALAVPPPCNATLPFNAGAAQSRGIEVGINALLTDHLQMDFSASVMDVELTEDAPGIGVEGDRLPAAPKFNASISLEYSTRWFERDAWLRGDLAHVGEFFNNFPGNPPRLGDYTQINLSAGLEFDHWTLEAYVDNLTDANESTWANPIWVPYDRESRLRPRTVGARVGYSFGDD